MLKWREKTVKKIDINATSMSFGEHIEELRTRLIRSLYGLIIAAAICLYYGNYILGFITKPLLVALAASGYDAELYLASPPEGFLTYIKICIYTGIFLASPWIFYQIWGFIAAGLYAHERRYVNLFMPFSASLFILGGIFFIYVVAPLSFNYFINFSTKWQTPELSDNIISRSLLKMTSKTYQIVQPQENDSTTDPNRTAAEKTPASQAVLKKPLVKPLFTLQKYVSLVVSLALVFGIAFQMPLLVFFLGRTSLVKIETLRANRKYVFFFIFVLAAIMTPPDVVSQVALGLPMYFLYELGILLIRIWPRKHPAPAEQG